MSEQEAELDELKGIIRETFWMARRYANGRKTSVPEVVNSNMEKLEKLGVTIEDDDSLVMDGNSNPHTLDMSPRNIDSLWEPSKRTQVKMGLSKLSEEHRNGHTLEYKVGDLFALMPTTGPSVKIIPHVCNDIGGWGSGFVIPLAKHYPDAESQYRRWYESKLDQNQSFELGRLGLVKVKEDTTSYIDGNVFVANMIAQHNTIHQDANLTPIRYWALAECMKRLAFAADQFQQVEFHAPKFGSDRAGGSWDVIETLIEELWVPIGNVTIYTLE